MKLNEIEEILNKKCMICGMANRFHKIFWQPEGNYFVKQQIEKTFLNEPLITGHAACLNNLEYLEYMEYLNEAED